MPTTETKRPTISKKKLMDAATRIGATIEFRQGGGWPEVLVEAPLGSMWDDGDGIHEQVNAGRRGESIVALYGEAFDRMQCGIVPCTIPNCEWCADRSSVEAL